MRAIVHTIYGPPEVAKLKEVDKPLPGANEILVKVFASTVNRTDCGFRSAEYFISRFWSGLFKPKYQTLGCEFAGKVVSLGQEVKSFKIGDRVFGYNDQKFGGHAEFIMLSQSDGVATIPERLSYTQAAPILEGAHYALSIIRAANVERDQDVLVYGATGAIGSSAVQLLKYFGAIVTAVCNTKNIDLVKSLGADKVIDYTRQDFTKTDRKFDFAFDAVGKSSFKQCKPLLNKKGIYISTELGKNAENIFLALITPIGGGKKVLFPIPKFDQEVVHFLKALVEDGSYMPVIDREYDLEQIVEAYKYVESGQKTGNVVLKVASENDHDDNVT